MVKPLQLTPVDGLLCEFHAGLRRQPALEDQLSERDVKVRHCRGLRGRRARDGRVLPPRDRIGADVLGRGSRIRPPR